MIAPWVLILTVVTWDGVAVSHLQMGSAAVCEAAAKEWKKEVSVSGRVRLTSAICAKTGYY